MTKFYNNDVILKQIMTIFYFSDDERAKEEKELVNEVIVGEMMHFAVVNFKR